ncbi:MAG: coenzyme F420-0:L-glutamate ligase [archaeon]
MKRTLGTVARGIRAPIIKEGDDIVAIVVDSLKNSWENGDYKLQNGDVVAITESTVARSQGNYVTVDEIAAETREKLGGHIGVVHPIFSRNRFAMMLKGFARGSDTIDLMLGLPSDEVGNHLISVDRMDAAGVDETWFIKEDTYREIFGNDTAHPFTEVDYLEMYKEIITGENCNVNIYLANDPTRILNFTRNVLAADIHTRHRTKRKLLKAGAEKVFCLDDLCTEPKGRGGYNSDYGLLGSNKSTEEQLKLFPRDSEQYATKIQAKLKELTGKNVEVMVYGDGAFKDPVGKIWELADPVVSPGYTQGLNGTPNELKMKYFADNELAGLTKEEAARKMRDYINTKDANLVGNMASQGTTPRPFTDLLGSLSDLISGSGDKGTPIVLIQGYFDNYSSE